MGRLRFVKTSIGIKVFGERKDSLTAVKGFGRIGTIFYSNHLDRYVFRQWSWIRGLNVDMMSEVSLYMHELRNNYCCKKKDCRCK